MKKLFLLTILIIMMKENYAQLQYPVTPKTDSVDVYHGTKVEDPYRWLENDNSDATKDWVKEENAVTNAYMDKIPFREGFKKRLESVINYTRYSAPQKKGDWYYFYKNDGLQNQAVLYRQKGLNGTPETVIDPNHLSADGTTRLMAFSLSKNGKYAVWATSKGGSDWETLYVRDMETGKDLADELDWIKFSGIGWQGDGFYYSRYPAPDKGKELAGKNENHQVWFHKIGTAQSQDQLIYEDKDNGQRFHFVSVSEDERMVFLTISDRGKGLDGNALWYKDNLSKAPAFKPVVKEIGQNEFSAVDNIGDKLLIETNEGARNKKLLLFDPAKPGQKDWKIIIPEKAEPLQGVGTAGGKLFVSYLKDVTSRIYVYDYAGTLLKEVKLPALGSAGGFGGEKEDAFTFYTFSSFNFPPVIYKYDIATGTSTLFQKPDLSFDPSDYTVEQAFYTSKDQTKIPVFIVAKKGITKNGKNPTLLYGYGGVNISLTPAFSASLIPWLEQGGIYAIANLRGGGEYGEQWHEAGMKLKKQNVFDDFIAAAEYLIREKYTSKAFLSIRGGSNGGLLVGAVLNQRPDLFKVAIAQVGVMDMLRFQKFTIGWNWIADYGSSDNADEFKVLYQYSPLHNIRAIDYPATLITTADHDDRVVPAHSFKYAATLQEKNTSKNPVLIQIDTNSGHGASNTAKNIESMANIYSFILFNMGITPVFKQ